MSNLVQLNNFPQLKDGDDDGDGEWFYPEIRITGGVRGWKVSITSPEEETIKYFGQEEKDLVAREVKKWLSY